MQHCFTIFFFCRFLLHFSYVCSGVEYEHCVMDCSQMRGLGDIKPDDPSNSERGSTPDNEPRGERFTFAYPFYLLLL